MRTETTSKCQRIQSVLPAKSVKFFVLALLKLKRIPAFQKILILKFNYMKRG